MTTAILREHVYFSTAEGLYRELEALDTAFRKSAYVVDIDYEEERTFSGSETTYITLTLEAELDVSS